MKLEEVIKRGTRASQPAATAVATGTLYGVTDEGNKIERSNGTTWDAYSPTAAASGAWTLITSLAASAASHDFTGLAGYSEIMVMIKQVTATGACIRQLLVSIDNGANFLNASGDYLNVASTGAESNGTVISFSNSNNSTAQTSTVTIKGFNLTSPKNWENSLPTADLNGYIPTANALNAVRVRASSNAFNGGTIYIFGRGL